MEAAEDVESKVIPVKATEEDTFVFMPKQESETENIEEEKKEEQPEEDNQRSTQENLQQKALTLKVSALEEDEEREEE